MARIEITIAAVLITAWSAPQASCGQPTEFLEKAAAQADAFTIEFPALVCTERVTQVRFAQGEKVSHRRQSVFDYLILMDASGVSFSVEESRLEKSAKQKDPPQALLATTGFAVMGVIFHPHFQPSYRFEEIEPETLGGVTWRRIRFEQLAGRPTPTVLEVQDREYPIAWRGTAWLEPSTGAVKRIQTELREPLPDIGLLQLKSTVDYEAAGAAIPVWVPRLAVVEARTAHQHWRNEHEFSAYRKFGVTTGQKVQEVSGK